MIQLAAAEIGKFTKPEIDWAAFAPLLAVLAGATLILMIGLFRSRAVQHGLVPVLAIASLGAAIGLAVGNWEVGDTTPIVAGALAVDTLAYGIAILACASGILAILLSWRSATMRETGHGEYACLMLGSIGGMILLAGAENMITLFIGLELLSIPLYVLCGSRVREQHSLEAGLKYLIVGSVGSATLLYGLALIYGATGSTDLGVIGGAIGNTVELGDPLLLTGVAMVVAGLAFKASVAPFHQWTPDVYQGAPTPVTAFMAVATKAAAIAIVLRLFGEGLFGLRDDWAPALAALAVTTIVIGNVGAIGARSMKRMLGWSGVAQAGYMLVGVVVGTRLGLQATAFYLAGYLVMNMAAFAVVVARERVTERGDDISALEGLGRSSPWLAWPMTIAMLALAGFPATVGFIGKFYLIDAAVDGDYAWLGIAIVVGSMISLVYYLRVIATMWMGPVEIDIPAPGGSRRVRPVAGWSPEADARAQPEVTFVAILCAAATVALGIVPGPLFDVARDVGTSLSALL
ncbi:MAG: NADH-quinone oxidoreductase subunit N [Actinomycetota bacterium]|nr:NADH-quinone oxidoreductase subunit N [Actinomycetota bacterium]